MYYITGSKYYHSGYFNSKEDTVEIFKDYKKELNVRCGVNNVFAFSREGDLLYYSTDDIDNVVAISCIQEQKISDLKSTDCNPFVLFDGKVLNK